MTAATAPPSRRRARLIAWGVCATAVAAGEVAWLVALRGPGVADRLPVLIGGQVLLTLPLVAMAVLLRSTPPDAIRLPARSSRSLILQTAALLQVLALVMLGPAASEDLARYRVDGGMWLAGSSPYVTSPAVFFIKHPPDAIDRLVRFPTVRTIYPPVAEAIFAACRALEPDVRTPIADWHRGIGMVPWWERAPVFRAAMAGFAVAGVALLLALLRRAGRSPWWAVVFGWSPLLVIEAAGSGHIDVAGVFFVLAALYLLPRRPGWSGAMLLLAAGIKPQAALLLLFLARDGGLGVVRGFVFAAIPTALPLLYHAGYEGLLATLGGFSDRWEANGSVYELFKAVFGAGDLGRNMLRAKDAARLLAQAAVLVTLYRAWTRRLATPRAGVAIMLVLLLSSPVAYPWYLLWALVLVPLAPAWTALVWSGTIAIAYVTWANPQWRVPGGWLLVEYVPVYLAAGADLMPARTRPGTAAGPGLARTPATESRAD